ncbi:MAG: phosphate acetyltransferase [Gammaproteobacteria bacterium]|nr:phosphate acetyltransferase [Gammaproteobacteria bacterium]
MTRYLYVTGVSPRSGKDAFALGFMERFSATLGGVGFFRPIIANESDPALMLMRQRYRLSGPLSDYYGYLAAEAHHLIGDGQRDELYKTIIGKFQVLRQRFTAIICEGADYGSSLPGQEFEFNLELANHLGCHLLPVLNGKGRDAAQLEEDLHALCETLQHHHSTPFAVIVNRTAEAVATTLRSTIGATLEQGTSLCLLAERAILDMPTVGAIGQALNAEVLVGSDDLLSQEVADFKVAAMELPHFLDHVREGSLIITPGDRADIILGALMANHSIGYPKIAGLLLTGGIRPAAQIVRLVEGLRRPSVPMLLVASDTFTTALAVSAVESHIEANNPRKVAAALGLMEGLPLALYDLNLARGDRESHEMTPLRFEYELVQRARLQRKHIVLPEGEEERVLRAAEILLLRDVVALTLLGDPTRIKRRISQLGLQLGSVTIIDPTQGELRQRYAEALFQARQHKGITLQMAWDMVEDVSYFGTMMVHCGDADGMVSGAVHTTQHTIRPAFQVIRARPGHQLISSVFLMSLPDRVVVYGDCAVNPDPDAQELAEIAITSAATARQFGIEPRVAMLSYATGDSGAGSTVDKVRAAVALAHARDPELKIDGPIQFDAAVDSGVARTKLPQSEVAGRATVFIFPDLNTGNNTYKAVQRSANAVAIGPILQGLNRPVNDLSRGCTVTDIVNTVALTAIQAQSQ